MTTDGARFPREDRLLDARDFRRLGREGRRAASRAFVVLVAPGGHGSREGRARLGITASRRVGGAVVRNRVKRRVREWFRNTPPAAADWVVIARSGAVELGAEETFLELDRLAAEAAR